MWPCPATFWPNLQPPPPSRKMSILKLVHIAKHSESTQGWVWKYWHLSESLSLGGKHSIWRGSPPCYLLQVLTHPLDGLLEFHYILLAENMPMEISGFHDETLMNHHCPGTLRCPKVPQGWRLPPGFLLSVSSSHIAELFLDPSHLFQISKAPKPSAPNFPPLFLWPSKQQYLERGELSICSDFHSSPTVSHSRSGTLADGFHGLWLL